MLDPDTYEVGLQADILTNIPTIPRPDRLAPLQCRCRRRVSDRRVRSALGRQDRGRSHRGQQAALGPLCPHLPDPPYAAPAIPHRLVAHGTAQADPAPGDPAPCQADHPRTQNLSATAPWRTHAPGYTRSPPGTESRHPAPSIRLRASAAPELSGSDAGPWPTCPQRSRAALMFAFSSLCCRMATTFMAHYPSSRAPPRSDRPRNPAPTAGYSHYRRIWVETGPRGRSTVATEEWRGGRSLFRHPGGWPRRGRVASLTEGEYGLRTPSLRNRRGFDHNRAPFLPYLYPNGREEDGRRSEEPDDA